MQMQYSYRAIDKEFHEPWQRALGNVIEHALKPLLDKHTKDSARLQIVLDRDKIKRQFLASGYMHLPGKLDCLCPYKFQCFTFLNVQLRYSDSTFGGRFIVTGKQIGRAHV